MSNPYAKFSKNHVRTQGGAVRTYPEPTVNKHSFGFGCVDVFAGTSILVALLYIYHDQVVQFATEVVRWLVGG